MNLIALSIPVFFVLMGIEWAISWWRGLTVYRFADWVANLGCGIIQQTTKGLVGLAIGGGYLFIYFNYRWMDLDGANVWVWVVCVVGVDFCYYWFHRMSHELNFLWAAHVVHHQSEEYNLGVSLRQSAFQGLFSWFFYLPLALIGFPPLVVGVQRAINALYQFLIHTQLVGRLGPLEWILNTPSHHRVHHGQNPQYIDRNHGGMFIIWDRLFGTFEEEKEPVIYGVTEPPDSWDPIFANFHHFYLSGVRMAQANRGLDWLRVWLNPPGYVPKGVSERGKKPLDREKYDTSLSPQLRRYVFGQLFVIVVATVGFLFVRADWPAETQLMCGLAIVLSTGIIGGLLDGRLWAFRLETVRPTLVGLGVMLVFAAKTTEVDLVQQELPLIIYDIQRALNFSGDINLCDLCYMPWTLLSLSSLGVWIGVSALGMRQVNLGR